MPQFATVAPRTNPKQAIDLMMSYNQREPAKTGMKAFDYAQNSTEY